MNQYIDKEKNQYKWIHKIKLKKNDNSNNKNMCQWPRLNIISRANYVKYLMPDVNKAVWNPRVFLKFIFLWIAQKHAGIEDK